MQTYFSGNVLWGAVLNTSVGQPSKFGWTSTTKFQPKYQVGIQMKSGFCSVGNCHLHRLSAFLTAWDRNLVWNKARKRVKILCRDYDRAEELARVLEMWFAQNDKSKDMIIASPSKISSMWQSLRLKRMDLFGCIQHKVKCLSILLELEDEKEKEDHHLTAGQMREHND